MDEDYEHSVTGTILGIAALVSSIVIAFAVGPMLANRSSSKPSPK